MSDRIAYVESLGNMEVITAVAYAGDGSALVVPIKHRTKTDYCVQVSANVVSKWAVTAKTLSSFTITGDNTSTATLLDFIII
jgi:hypothetical protein